MDSNELNLGNIDIKTHELDLDKYLEGLVRIKEDIERYKSIKGLMYRCVMINYDLHKRVILRGFETDISKKWKEYFASKQVVLEKELEEIQFLIDRFDFENTSTWKEITDKKVLDYFFPNEIDFAYINRLRKSGFEADFNDYKLKTKLRSISEKLIIQSILENVTYNYTEYYKDGEPPQMVALRKSRESISMDIGMDLGKYDLIKYLKNRLNEIENGSNNIQKHNKIELSYDDIFTSIEAKEKAFNAMIELGMIDKNYNYLMGKNRSFIRSFIEICIEKGLIYGNESIKITPLSKAFVKKIGLNIDRLTESKGYEKGKIRKVFLK